VKEVSGPYFSVTAEERVSVYHHSLAPSRVPFPLTDVQDGAVVAVWAGSLSGVHVYDPQVRFDSLEFSRVRDAASDLRADHVGDGPERHEVGDRGRGAPRSGVGLLRQAHPHLQLPGTYLLRPTISVHCHDSVLSTYLLIG
jgi:hypothetical protein